MDWEKYKIWQYYLFNTQYKDSLISKAIGEFSRVVSDCSKSFQLKKDINKDEYSVCYSKQIIQTEYKCITETICKDNYDKIKIDQLTDYCNNTYCEWNIASDNIDRGTYTELWIITEFHSNGSLFDYLNQNTLTIYECLKMAISIVNGLDHLHTPIESCTGKPALAHCDLKSKNILVKSDLTCCIGDLGLALCGDKNGQIITSLSTISNNDQQNKIIRFYFN